MIHMLSNFNLKDGVTAKEFSTAYKRFVEAAQDLGFVEKSEPVGRRVRHTPMDTADENEPEYYAVMSFSDRNQLDAAYEHFLRITPEAMEQSAHTNIHAMIVNPVFTCWQDEE